MTILKQLENYLSLTDQRAAVIASNMANIDTPGYQTRDIDFQHELARAAASPDGSAPQPTVGKVAGLLDRPDGNNVDVDRESLGLAETQLQYQMGTQLLKARFHELLVAINQDQ